MQCNVIVSDDGTYMLRTEIINHVKLIGFIGIVVVALFDVDGNLITHIGPYSYGVDGQWINQRGWDRTAPEFGSISPAQVQRLDHIEITFGLGIRDLPWEVIKTLGDFFTKVAAAISSMSGQKSPGNLNKPANGSTQQLVNNNGAMLLRTGLSGLAPPAPHLAVAVKGGPVESGAPITITVTAVVTPDNTSVDGTVSYDGVVIGHTNQPITHTFVGHRTTKLVFETGPDGKPHPRQIVLIAFDALDIAVSGFAPATVGLPAVPPDDL